MSTQRPDDNHAPARSSGGDPPTAASRFAYHTETEPNEGGVRSVTPPGNRRNGSSPTATATMPSPNRNGVPGPAERLLDISELARNVGMQYTHRFHIPPHEADFIEYIAPLVGQVTLTNTGAVLLLRGDASTTLRLECIRCLVTTEQPVEAELEEEFDLVPGRNASHQEEVLAVDEDTPAAVIAGNVLDLGELLRQNLLLAAPTKPLCSEECPGLPNPAAGDEDDAAPQVPVADSPLRHLAELLADRENGADRNK